MEIELQYFDGCPNWHEADKRLQHVIGNLGIDSEIRYTEVKTDEQAAELGFRGSPTIRINGHDTFDVPESTASGLSCRVYQVDGGFDGSPTIEQLAEAIEHSK